MSDVLECDKALERLPPRIGPLPVATQWHEANYAADDKAQQVGQEPSNKMIAERT
jgi:hypothetical protein